MNGTTRILAGLAVSILVVGGCGEAGTNDRAQEGWSSAPAESRAPDSGTPQSEQPPTRFADHGHRLRWPESSTSLQSYWPHLDTLTMHGDLAITYGQTEPGLFAFDMKTGEFRWRFPVKHAVDTGENRTSKIVTVHGEPTLFAVFRIKTPARGTTPSSHALRLYALNLRGEKLWQAEVPEGEGFQLAAASSDVVAADAEHVVVHSTADSRRLGTTVVFSVRERKALWHRERFTGVAVRDGIVVGNGLDETKKRTEIRDQVMGLRATDGSTSWTSPEARRVVVSTEAYRMNDGGDWLPAVRGESWKDDFGVVRATTGEFRPVPMWLDPETCYHDGEPQFCASSDWRCYNDRRTVTACLSRAPSARILIAFDNTTGEPLWQLPNESSDRVAPDYVTTAWNGALYGSLEDQGLVLNLRSGRDQVSRMPALPIRVNGRFGAFEVDKQGTVEFRRALG